MTDVFVSFSKDYDIDSLDARRNVVKVLFLLDPSYENHHDFLDKNNEIGYDLLCTNKDFNDDLIYIDSNKTLMAILEDFVLDKYDY